MHRVTLHFFVISDQSPVTHYYTWKILHEYLRNVDYWEIYNFQVFILNKLKFVLSCSIRDADLSTFIPM